MVAILEIILIIIVVAVFVCILEALNMAVDTGEHEENLEMITEVIKSFPDSIVKAIGEGKLAVTIEWIEVTRDEDDCPSIRPRITIVPAKIS
jgi:hypothetical protein